MKQLVQQTSVEKVVATFTTSCNAKLVRTDKKLL